MMLAFLWGKKRAMIAYDTLIGATSEGGLGLLDPWIRKKSLRVKVVKRFLDSDISAIWKEVIKFYLKKCGDFKEGYNMLWMKTKNYMMNGIPCYYREVFEAWGDFLSVVQIVPNGRDHILEKPLFLIQNIQMDNNSIYFRNWWEAGFRQVKDILYEVKEGYLPLQAVIDAMDDVGTEGKPGTLYKQYQIVKNAIPQEWLDKINKGKQESDSRKYPEVYFLGEKEERIRLSEGT